MDLGLNRKNESGFNSIWFIFYSLIFAHLHNHVANENNDEDLMLSGQRERESDLERGGGVVGSFMFIY